jgi:crotonobetainyl-CoA:carnitine CoA-transferase CaiB-like acyl-CoA transferase
MAHTYEEIYEAVMDYNKNIAQGIVVPGRVTSPMETMKTENWWVRRSFEMFHDPYFGDLTVANQAWKMTATPPRLKWLCRPVGGDNEYIYSRKLGLGPNQLESLKAKGII